MKKLFISVILFIVSSMSLFAIPFFGYDVEDEYAKIVESIKDEDKFSKIQSAIEKYADEYLKESQKLDADYSRATEKIEDKAEELFEKLFSAKKESQVDKYASQIDELDTKMDALKDEYKQNRKALDKIKPQGLGPSVMILAQHEFDGDGSSESWNAAIWILDTFGIAPYVEVYAPGATSAADSTLHLRLTKMDLENRGIDLRAKLESYLAKSGITPSSIVMEDASKVAVSDISNIDLTSPWNNWFSAQIKVLLHFSLNGIGGQSEIMSQEYSLDDTVVFPSIEDDECIIIGWSAGDDIRTLYDNGDSKLLAGGASSELTYKAQYVRFDVSCYVGDINGNDNRNGKANINELVNLYPVIKNTGTVNASFSVSLSDPGVDGFVFKKMGEAERSFKNVKPGDFVVSAGEASAFNRSIDSYLRNYSPKEKYQAQISEQLEGVDSIVIPVTVECMNVKQVKEVMLPVSRSVIETELITWGIDDRQGNESKSANPGETITMDAVILLTANSDNAKNAKVTLSSDSPYVRISKGTISFSDVEKGDYISVRGRSYSDSNARKNLDPDNNNAFKFVISSSATPSQIPFRLTFSDGLGTVSTQDIIINVDYVDADINLIKWDYMENDKEGNGDGKANPGETINIGYLLRNDGRQTLDNVVVSLSCLTDGVRMSTSKVRTNIDELEPGRSMNVSGKLNSSTNVNTGVRYNSGLQVKIPSNHPIGTPVEISWRVTGNGADPDGWSGKFVLPVKGPSNWPELITWGLFGDNKKVMLDGIKRGQTFALEFAVRNAGDGKLKNLSWTFSTDSPYIDIQKAGPFKASGVLKEGEIQISFRNSVYLKGSTVDLTNRLGSSRAGMSAKMSSNAPIGSVQNIYINLTDGFATWTETIPIKVVI